MSPLDPLNVGGKMSIDINKMYGKEAIALPSNYIEENNIDAKNGLNEKNISW